MCNKFCVGLVGFLFVRELLLIGFIYKVSKSYLYERCGSSKLTVLITSKVFKKRKLLISYPTSITTY